MKQIIAWVDTAERKAINAANKNNVSVIFTRNKNDFVEYLNSNAFPIISIKKAKRINSIRKIVRSFPNLKFYVLTRLDDKPTTPNELSLIVDEPNISNSDGSRSQYLASEIFSLFEAQHITQQNS